MAITPLPDPPQRTNADFADKADAWIAAIDTWTTQTNALAVEVDGYKDASAQSVIDAAAQVALAEDQVALAVIQANNASNSAISASESAYTALNAPGTAATSMASLSISSGSKTLTVQTGKSLVPGMMMLIYNSSSSWMHGNITSYNSITGELIINVSTIFGSGTYSNWTVSLSAPIPEVPSNSSILFFNSNFI